MANDGEMQISVYLLTIGLPLVTLLLIFGMKYWSAVLQARARLANDEMYQTLAARAVTAQLENQAALTSIRAEIASLSASVAAIEKILQQVE